LTFDISETELVYQDAVIFGYGFDMGTVTLSAQIPGLPPSLASKDEDDSPRIILPLGEEARGVLGFRLSPYMAEQSWIDTAASQIGSNPPPILTALTNPLVDAWLMGDEAERKRTEEIAANPTPFLHGTMLAAFDRACQAAECKQAPHQLLRHSAQDRSAALKMAIAKAEAKRDSNLRKSLRQA